MSSRGPVALVRISLFTLVFGAFALGMIQPSQAGTEAAPEIQDPNNDKVTADTVPTGAVPVLGYAELVAGWVHNETATDLTVAIKTNAAVTTSLPAGLILRLEYHMTIAGADRVAYLNVSTAVTTGGVATAHRLDGVRVFLTVPKALVGNPSAGAEISVPFITSDLVDGPVSVASDRAPNTGGGSTYAMTGGSGTPVVPGDSDNDQLNDTCEQQFFGGLNGTNNATEDPDGDGLTNGQECASNPRTDPTKADTDGDGVNDDNDSAPTDPTKGGSGGTNSTSTSTSASGSASTSSSGTSSRTDTGTGGDSAGGDGEVKNLGDAVDKLTSDMGYLGTSAGGLVAVLLLAILALAVRWSL